MSKEHKTVTLLLLLCSATIYESRVLLAFVIIETVAGLTCCQGKYKGEQLSESSILLALSATEVRTGKMRLFFLVVSRHNIARFYPISVPCMMLPPRSTGD